MHEKLKVLDLFSGIGGFSLGLERTGGFETVAFCEIDPFCRQVLKKHWPDVPIFEDVRKLTADAIGPVNIIVGGYPCQPFSLAGKRRGAEDDRHLWPEVKRLVASIRPRWCLFENVAGHISMGLDEVLSDLEGEGYTAWTLVIPACAVDAPHRRDRVWIVANSKSDDARQLKKQPRNKKQQNNKEVWSGLRLKPSGSSEDVAHANGDRTQGGAKQGGNGGDGTKPGNQQPERLRGIPGGRNRGKAEWLPEPAVGRVAHGVPSRVDRLRALGNAVVPQIPEIIGRAILKAEGW